MKFGNWIIVEDGIQWDGEGTYPTITKERLHETRDFEGVKVYDWLTHMAEKTWVTETDVYALNTAFLFALEHFGVSLNPDISLGKTIVEQNKIVERKISELASH